MDVEGPLQYKNFLLECATALHRLSTVNQYSSQWPKTTINADYIHSLDDWSTTSHVHIVTSEEARVSSITHNLDQEILV